MIKNLREEFLIFRNEIQIIHEHHFGSSQQMNNNDDNCDATREVTRVGQ